MLRLRENKPLLTYLPVMLFFFVFLHEPLIYIKQMLILEQNCRFLKWALPESLMHMMNQVLFDHFWMLSLFSTMPTYAHACIVWSKYKTARVGRNDNIFFWITKRNLFKSEEVFQFLIERLFKQSLQSKTNGGDILEWELNWWQIYPHVPNPDGMAFKSTLPYKSIHVAINSTCGWV